MGKRSRNRNRPKKRSVTGAMSAINSELKDLLTYQKQQIRFASPNVPDVMYPEMKQKIHSFSCNLSVGYITGSTTAPSTGAYYFNLGQLSIATGFSNLFDRWRLLYVNVQFNPLTGAQSGGALCTAIDYDDASNPAVEIYQRDTSQVVPIGTYFERTLTPRMAVGAYSGSTFSGYANLSGGNWIDTNSPSVQLYGLKYYLPTQLVAGNVYNVTARYFLQFKNNF